MTTKTVGANCFLRTEAIQIAVIGGGQATVQSATVFLVPLQMRILPASNTQGSEYTGILR